MQTPKARKSSSEALQRSSPQAASSDTPKKSSPGAACSDATKKCSPRVSRQLKVSVQDSNSTSLTNPQNRTPKERSPKITERRSPRSPLPEKKRPSRVAELESQISQLQNDLAKVKGELSTSESWKKQAEQEAEDAKKELLAVSSKLGDSEKLLVTATEKAQALEAGKDSEKQEENLQAEIEKIQKQQFHESAALTCALTEINELKLQLENVSESEATRIKQTEQGQMELHCLKEKLAETLFLVEDMKNQLQVTKESEAQAQALVGETLLKLEIAKKTVETLRSDGTKAAEAYDAIASELEQSRARSSMLEELVSKLQADVSNSDCNTTQISDGSSERIDPGDQENEHLIEVEVSSMKSEVEYLRSALEEADTKFNEDKARSIAELRNAHELVEQIKSASNQRETQLESELEKLKIQIEELKANLMDKENELQGICEENENLNARLENLSGQRDIELEKDVDKAKVAVEDMKANLMDKENELQHILEENETLNEEFKKRDGNRGKANDDVSAELEASKAAEREALMKLEYMKEEVDKSNRRAARATEQLEAAQVANSEMEAELRRLKVQSDQWRKAAEAAASMLSSGNNGKFMERTGSMDSNYCPRTGKLSSPYAEEMDEDMLKKKNANMLKRIGVLWKKPHK